MSGQIFNVAEPAHPSEFQTSAAQAQANAPTASEARQVEANAEQAKDVAQNAAYNAQAKGPALTGQSATDRLQTDASVKTGAAVEEGQQDVAAAKAAAGGYVEQAKNLASSAVATAQSYLPPGSGENGAHTAGDVVSGLQAGANAALATTKEYLAAAQETAQPHLVKAKDMAQNYLPGSDALLNVAQQFMGAQTHDHEQTVRKASQENPEDAEYYQQASQHVAEHTEHHRPLSDEEAENAKDAHDKIYKQGQTDDMQSMGADAVGGAVVTQVLKQFASGGGGNPQDLVAMAMTEASKLLGGGADSGFKGQVMQKVAIMAFKSQLSGGSSGGMMTLLQKFM
ncbi:hypothetical protein FB451DRAFT_1502811 [Mycena latifolia]|nr:hypothetical protein FB451DRAFT_1502811 [Mycena latifolia]